MACSSQPLPAEHATEVSGDSGDEMRFDAEILLEELHARTLTRIFIRSSRLRPSSSIRPEAISAGTSASSGYHYLY